LCLRSEKRIEIKTIDRMTEGVLHSDLIQQLMEAFPWSYRKK